MYSKIEKKVAEYEKKHPIKSDEELEAAIEGIIKKEESRRASKRDYDLIEEAETFLYSLRGNDPDALDERAETAAREAASDALERYEKENITVSRPGGIKWRRVIPVAVAVVLLSSLIVSASFAFVLPPEPFVIDDDYKQAFNGMEPGSHYVSQDGSFEIYAGSPVAMDIKTLDELAALIDYPGVYLPMALDEKYEVNGINYTDYGSFYSITFGITDDKGVKSSFTVETRETWRIELETVKVGEFDMYLCNYIPPEDPVVRYQSEFEHLGYSYTISSFSPWSLFDIIESLEEVNK